MQSRDEAIRPSPERDLGTARVKAPDHGFWSPREDAPREPVWSELAPAPAPVGEPPEDELEPLEPHWLDADSPADPPDWTDYQLGADDVDDPEDDPALGPQAGPELSEKLQRLLEAVDNLDEHGLSTSGAEASTHTPDELVIEADPLADANGHVVHVDEAAHDDLPQRADQPASLIIRYDAGVELRFSGQSAVFLERLLRVSADLDALARALPPAGEGGVAEPPAH
jgi:hypothetical protein